MYIYSAFWFISPMIHTRTKLPLQQTLVAPLQTYENPYRSPSRITKTIWGLCIIGVLLVAGIIVFKLSSTNAQKFQVVFLKNGQIFFGKVSMIDDHVISLNHVYYLKHEEGSVLELKGPDAALNVSALDNINPNEGRLLLIKQGGEYQGSSTDMKIPKENVLFWENLREDSHIYRSIMNSQ